jgi:hypothetical protein
VSGSGSETDRRPANGSEASAGGPPPWTAAIRDVAVAAALVVAVVLGAAILTSILPVEGQRLVFHTPVTIAVLIGVTGWVLWRVARRQPPRG